MKYLYLPRSDSDPPFVGKIVQWLLPSGSRIGQGDAYLTVETEKVINELVSEHEGWLYYSEQLTPDHLLNHEIAIAAIADEKLDASDERSLMDYLGRELAAKEITSGTLFKLDWDIEFPKKAIANKRAIKLAKLFEARQLSYSSSHAAYSMVAINIDIEPVQEKITGYKSRDKISITVGELVAYEVSRILLDYPQLNACFFDGETYFYDQVTLGLAMDIAGKGLKVVALPQADKKDLVELSAAVKNLGLCYLRGELTRENFRDITFSISDVSSSGAIDMIPTINIFQSAILGICAVNKKTGDFKLCLAFDHRVADGVIGMAMLRKLKDRLESVH